MSSKACCSGYFCVELLTDFFKEESASVQENLASILAFSSANVFSSAQKIFGMRGITKFGKTVFTPLASSKVWVSKTARHLSNVVLPKVDRRCVVRGCRRFASASSSFRLVCHGVRQNRMRQSYCLVTVVSTKNLWVRRGDR